MAGGDYVLLADEDLMTLVARRDARAFAALYDRLGRASYSLAYRIVGDRQGAEDVTQDAFMKIWRSAGTYRTERSSARTWIFAVVRNRGIDRLRSRASHNRMRVRVALHAPKHQPSEVLDGLLHSWQRDRVRRALQSLPIEQVEVLELAYFSGLSQTEISRTLDLPLGTVKGRTRQALAKLKIYLDSSDAAAVSP